MAKRNTSTKKSVKKTASKRTSAKAVKASRKQIKPIKSSPKSAKSQKQASLKFKSPVPRSPSNPFREASSYAIAFDLLASNPQGMSRQDLVARLAKATGKPVKNAAFDAAVLLSARPDGRHQSCRPGFVVERENDHVRLRITASKAAN